MGFGTAAMLPATLLYRVGLTGKVSRRSQTVRSRRVAAVRWRPTNSAPPPAAARAMTETAYHKIPHRAGTQARGVPRGPRVLTVRTGVRRRPVCGTGRPARGRSCLLCGGTRVPGCHPDEGCRRGVHQPGYLLLGKRSGPRAPHLRRRCRSALRSRLQSHCGHVQPRPAGPYADSQVHPGRVLGPANPGADALRSRALRGARRRDARDRCALRIRVHDRAPLTWGDNFSPASASLGKTIPGFRNGPPTGSPLPGATRQKTNRSISRKRCSPIGGTAFRSSSTVTRNRPTTSPRNCWLVTMPTLTISLTRKLNPWSTGCHSRGMRSSATSSATRWSACCQGGKTGRRSAPNLH